MSYEGYTEHLCSNGHYSSFDAVFMGEEEKCHCGEAFVFRHSVDQTNGIEYDNEGNEIPGTIGYPFEENGFTSVWHKDHYGNEYATKLILYKIPKKEGEKE